MTESSFAGLLDAFDFLKISVPVSVLGFGAKLILAVKGTKFVVIQSPTACPCSCAMSLLLASRISIGNEASKNQLPRTRPVSLIGLVTFFPSGMELTTNMSFLASWEFGEAAGVVVALVDAVLVVGTTTGVGSDAGGVVSEGELEDMQPAPIKLMAIRPTLRYLYIVMDNE